MKDITSKITTNNNNTMLDICMFAICFTLPCFNEDIIIKCSQLTQVICPVSVS